MNINEKHQAKQTKDGWVRPEVKRLEAGAAESNFSGASDGGGGAQGVNS